DPWTIAAQSIRNRAGERRHGIVRGSLHDIPRACFHRTWHSRRSDRPRRRTGTLRARGGTHPVRGDAGPLLRILGAAVAARTAGATGVVSGRRRQPGGSGVDGHLPLACTSVSGTGTAAHAGGWR